MAVELGQVSLMRAFLEHGADPNAPGIDGGKPLNTAVENARIEVVRLLLDAGADPNGKDEWGVTPQKVLDNDLQFARNKMPASWDPKGEHATCMEAIRELIQAAGGREFQDLGGDAQTRFFKSLLSHLPEQERTSFAKSSTPQVLYPYGVKICESLGKGATRQSLIEGNLDQFFPKSVADAIFDAATDTICPKAAAHS
jgi:Ankyrin repeats (many copies)